jgi:hypothetical protein
MTTHQVLVCVLLLCGPTTPGTESDHGPCTAAPAEEPSADPGSVPDQTLIVCEPDQPPHPPTTPSPSTDPCATDPCATDPCPADPEILAAPPEAPVSTPSEEPSHGHTRGQQAQTGQQGPDRGAAEVPQHGVADEPTKDRSPTDPRGTDPPSYGLAPGSPAPSERNGPVLREPDRGRVVPAATATVPAPVPSEAAASKEDAPNPVGHFAFGDPAPSNSVPRVVGAVSTALLILLGIGVLALRLTVGWPRFPTLYLGRRRSGTLD